MSEFLTPTRTVLLALKEKSSSVAESIEILGTKRVALIREFMKAAQPFLRSRAELGGLYGRALDELALSVGAEGASTVQSIAAQAAKEPAVRIIDRRLWGLGYKDVEVYDSPLKGIAGRGYDYSGSTPHMEECASGFERLVDAVIQVASYESKIKRLSQEIISTTRRMRVLEERVLPRIRGNIKAIGQYLEEREREARYRLKRALRRQDIQAG